MLKDDSSDTSVVEEVSYYIAKSGEGELPTEVVEKAKHHILDTLAAIVTGSELKPGQIAKKYIRSQAGAKEAQVIGTRTVTSAINSAFANGIMGHADETDDSHPRSNTHPGCGIVPAALSMSEREQSNGMNFLRGVVAGYDIGCRITQVLGVDDVHKMQRCTHSIGNNFGAAVAAASVAQLETNQVRQVLSYASDQASGIDYFSRDTKHVEKAFIFGGMPARNGVTSAILVQSGFTGIEDAFSGANNFLEAFSPSPKPQLLLEGLGSHYEIMSTNIKRFPVGSPIQAALDALLLLINKHKIVPKDIKSIIVRLPERGAKIVNNRDMPDINLQYLLSVALLDGRLNFKAAHSYKRMNDPEVLKVKNLINLVGDPELTAAKIMRQGIVEITTKDGALLREHVVSVRGTVENPMTREEVEEKSQDLMTPILGKDRTLELIKRIWNLEQVRNVRELRPFLSPPKREINVDIY
ncbi:MmgE/PrpD family protein [Chloroflexota bacterium]